MANETLTSRTRAATPLPMLVLVSLITAIGVGGIFAVFVLRRIHDPAAPADNSSTLQRVITAQTLHVGYEGYPPYTIKDPSTGKLSGYSVDLAEYICREAGWKLEWIQTSPDTKIPDLQSGKFDVMTEPIYRTIPRGSRVTFSRPYAYFGDAVGVVRKGDHRFKVIDDLNKPGVTIVVRQGYTDQTFASDNLPAATLRVLKVDDASQLFLDVISGKADVVLSDMEQAKSFAAQHPKQVDLLFTDPAPSYIPAGFMLRQGDFTFYNFLNTSLDYMEANSVLMRLNRKYGLSPGQPPALR